MKKREELLRRSIKTVNQIVLDSNADIDSRKLQILSMKTKLQSNTEHINKIIDETRLIRQNIDMIQRNHKKNCRETKKMKSLAIAANDACKRELMNNSKAVEKLLIDIVPKYSSFSDIKKDKCLRNLDEDRELAFLPQLLVSASNDIKVSLKSIYIHF